MKINEYDIDKSEVENVLKLNLDKIKDNTEIITPLDINQPYLYHIALGIHKELVPNISRRSGLTENNTLPRVHTSIHLDGCLQGYAGIAYLVSNYIVGNKKKNKGVTANFLGGFYIYEIPFRAALKPSNKLVFDASFTNELWLITYNEMTKTYPCNNIGKIIIENATFIPIVGKPPIQLVTFLVEVRNENGLPLDKKNYLTKGYWKFTQSSKGQITNLKSIDRSEFLKVKTISASMLDYQESLNKEKNIPRYMDW